MLRLRFDDFSRATRSHTLAEAQARTQMILPAVPCRAPPCAAVRRLLRAAMPLIEIEGLTLIGLALANLRDDSAVPLALPCDRQCADALDAALDARDRFGPNAITRSAARPRRRPTMPLLPG